METGTPRRRAARRKALIRSLDARHLIIAIFFIYEA
jgi:hypothetical protein